MPDLVVIVPSRQRPEAARELAEAFVETCTADTALVVVVDDDDPTREQYGDGVLVGAHTSMVDALNKTAVGFANLGEGLRPFAIGFMGDDHRPRTVGWDKRYLDVLREYGSIGFVFGNDLIQRKRLPTQIAMTTDVVRTLGYMSPPELRHLFVDNSWLRWGNGLGRLRYLREVIVEHCHPIAGTNVWDEGYRRVNGAEMANHDRAAFDEYVRTRLDEDIAKLRAAVCE